MELLDLSQPCWSEQKIRKNKLIWLFSIRLYISVPIHHIWVWLFDLIPFPRHTYENIKETGYFTLNHVPIDFYQQAHQTSAKYDRNQSEFEACGFTPFYSESITAPYVKESKIKFGLRFKEEYHIQANDTIFVIGEVLEIIVPDQAILPSGHVDQEDWGSIALAGLDTYYKVERLERMLYAKP